jgi:hypothetical protein
MYLSVLSLKIFSFLKKLSPVWIGHRKGLWFDFANTEFVCNSTEVFTRITCKALFSYPFQLSVAGAHICITVDTIIENTTMSTRFQVGNRFHRNFRSGNTFWGLLQLLELQFTVLYWKQIMICMYREVLTFVDWFMALRFTVTGALPAVRRIWILPMNQHAWWPITFGINGSY